MSKRAKRDRGRSSPSSKKGHLGQSSPYVPSLEELLDRAERLFMRGHYDRVLSLLDDAPEKYQRHPDFLLIRGQAYLGIGQPSQAADDLERYLKRRGKDTRLYFPLAMAYAQLELRAHALQATRRYLQGEVDNRQDEKAARELITLLEPDVMELHAAYGVPEDQCIPVSYYNEEAMHAMSKGDFKKAELAIKKAIAIAPKWPSPYNNRAAIQAMTGQLDDAIALCHEVLTTIAPGNLFATASLVMFYALRGDRELATPYLERLRQLTESELAESDLNKIVEALAYWEDVEALWRIARWALDEYDPLLLTSLTCYALGIAAMRTHHLDVARIYFDRVWESGWQAPTIAMILDELDEATDDELVLPTPTGTISCIPGVILLQAVPMEEFLSLLQERDAQDGWSDALVRKRDAFLRRYPHLELGLIRLFEDIDLYGEQIENQMGLLVSPGTARVYEILERFALGQRGPNDVRLLAMNILSQEGWRSPGGLVHFWDEELDEWHDVQLMAFEIKDPETSAYSDEVMDLLDAGMEARHAGDSEQAIALLQQALEVDPHCGQAAHNLGVMILQDEDDPSGREWIARAIEIEPDYVFAYATMAKLLIVEGKLDEALEYLDIFPKQKVIVPEAYIAYQEALLRLALARDDYEIAERILDNLEEMFPDHPVVVRVRDSWEAHEATSGLLDRFRDSFGYLHDYWLQSTHRKHNRMLNAPISPSDDVRACLDRLTKDDALTVTAKRLGLRGYGRKAELIESIARRLFEPGLLQDVVNDLTEPHRDALRVLLAHDGIMPWIDFTAVSGDDFDESPYWKYHEPETTPGVLKLYGLLTAGTYKDERVAMIPYDLRPLLRVALAMK